MKTIQFLGIIAAFALSSCGNRMEPWSQRQAAALPTVALGPMEKSAGSYQKPRQGIPGGSQATRNAAFISGLAGGPVGAAVGMAVISGKESAEQTAFEKEYAAPIARIESSLDHRLEGPYAKRAEQELKKTPFFARRLTKDSPHVIRGNVVRYGLARANSGEPKLFQAVVVMQWSLKGSGGEELLENVSTSSGSVTKGSLDDFASNKEFLNKAFREASTEAAAVLGNILRAKVQKVGP
jgi:hypothetical protein